MPLLFQRHSNTNILNRKEEKKLYIFMKNDYICKHNNGLFRLLIGNRPLSN